MSLTLKAILAARKRGGGGVTVEYFTPTGFGALRNDSNADVGLEFEVGASNISVSHLGRWVVAGNSGTHTVKLVRKSDLVTVGSVSVNTSLGTAASYEYVALASPITLSSGARYYLVSTETLSGDQWHDYSGTPGTAMTYDASISAQINAIYNTGGGYTNPNPTVFDKSYVPPGMKLVS